MEEHRDYQFIRAKPRVDLPAPYLRDIARVIVTYAGYEHQILALSWAICFLADPVGDKLGRLAFRQMKAEDQISLIERLAEVRGVKLDQSLIKEIKTRVKRVSIKRNLLAHGKWSKPGSYWVVQETQGSWENSLDGPRGRRAITPEVVPINSDVLRTIYEDAQKLLDDANRLRPID
jgi:hypothetical protein